MDTLTNSSSKPNNQQNKMRPASLRGSFQSPLQAGDEHTQLENMAGRIEPRYMTPTAASRAQVSTPEPPTSTPPATSSTGKRKAWMVSAAKRVGIVPGTPRSKKEGRIYKRISPRKAAPGKTRDKATYQHTTMSSSPLLKPRVPVAKEIPSLRAKDNHETDDPSPVLPAKDVPERGLRERPNPPDKPLPSLPIATVQTGSPIVRRSLIDASEKPLRRSTSPSPGEKIEQDWPVLFPSQPTTPETPQEMAQDVFFSQAAESTRNGSGSIPERPSCGHQQLDDLPQGPKTRSANYQPLRQGSQEVFETTKHQIETMDAGLASETKPHPARPEKEGALFTLDHEESQTNAANRKSLGLNDVTETESATGSARGATLGITGVTSSPPVQHTPSLHDGGKVRASRLPKRLSGPGPVRISGSPRRCVSGRSSPYTSLSSHTARGLSVKPDHLVVPTRKPVNRTNLQLNGLAARNSSDASGSVPWLIAVKQTSRASKPSTPRSSIPKPRHHFRLHQDPESEGEIVLSKLPKKKVGSSQVTADHKSDDGDLDTDDGHESKEDKKALEATQQPANQADQALCNGTATKEGNSEASTAEEVHRTALPPLDVPGGGKEAGIADVDRQENNERTITNSATAVDTQLTAIRQRPLVDKPFNRVKRLSAIAPEHGPTLRISDSAERIIMGYASEDDFESENDISARKHNSVPDLRRSVVIKELRKSTEELLNSHLPLSRSSTTRSLARLEPKESTSNRWNNSGYRESRTDTQGVNVDANTSSPEDPFSVCSGKTQIAAEDDTTKSSAGCPVDWPLKSSPQMSAELHAVKEDLAKEQMPWISPLQVTPAALVLNPKSYSPGSDQKSWPAAKDNSEHASSRSELRHDHTSGRENVVPLAVGTSSKHATSIDVRSAPQRPQYPLRISSRAETPDFSARSRAKVNHYCREIPNRFESAHPRRLSEDFSVPKSATIDPTTLRNSIHNLKDTEKSKVSTPATREIGRPQLSSAKGMLSNIKGLFHKRSMDTATAPSTVKSHVSGPGGRHATVGLSGSPCPNYPSRTLPATSGANKGTRGGVSVIPTPKDAFPPVKSDEPSSVGLDSDDYSQATDLAMRVLDAARREHESGKRGRLLQLGQLMVEAVTGARDAEKAMEEAKQAAGRAEMHCLRTKKSVLELTKLVGEQLDDS